MGRQADKIRDELIKLVEQKMKQIAIRFTMQVWLDNPEDTGFSEVNWIPDIGTRFSGTAGTYEQAKRGTLNRSYQLAGVDKISNTYKLKMGVINITNNVDYIGDLNDGSSKQAPAGYVQIAMAKAVNSVERG